MNLSTLNYSMYKAALHLSEAGKHMMSIDKKRGLELLQEADVILSIIIPGEEKVSEERLDEVLGEIFSAEIKEK